MVKILQRVMEEKKMKEEENQVLDYKNVSRVNIAHATQSLMNVQRECQRSQMYDAFLARPLLEFEDVKRLMWWSRRENTKEAS